MCVKDFLSTVQKDENLHIVPAIITLSLIIQSTDWRRNFENFIVITKDALTQCLFSRRNVLTSNTTIDSWAPTFLRSSSLEKSHGTADVYPDKSGWSWERESLEIWPTEPPDRSRSPQPWEKSIVLSRSGYALLVHWQQETWHQRHENKKSAHGIH